MVAAPRFVYGDSMNCAFLSRKAFSAGAGLVGMLAIAGGNVGMAADSAAPVVTVVSTTLSPVAERVAPRDAWRLAETYVAEHASCEVLVGSGDSMLPVYRDRTVLVVQHTPTSELRTGMTVVFIGDRGRPVAHALLEKTPRGWRAMGAGNREPDRTLVGYGNLIGVVVKAYEPTAAAEVATIPLKPAAESQVVAAN